MPLRGTARSKNREADIPGVTGRAACPDRNADQGGAAPTRSGDGVGYFAEHNLYIPTRENVRLDLYQSQSLRVQYTCPVGWSLDIEDEMVKGALAVVGAEINIDPRRQMSYPLRRNAV